MLYHENRIYESGFPINASIFHNKDFLAHWHSEIEVVLVCEGSLGMGINSEYYILEKGDIAICTSGDIHYYNSKNMESTIILTVFRPELIGNVINLLTNIRFKYPVINASVIEELNLDAHVIDNIKTCINNIFNEINQKNSHYQVFTKSNIIELIGLFLRHIPYHSINLSCNIVSGEESRLMKAINYIENNYTQDISLEDVAKFLDINPFYFSRVFNRGTGLNFKTYLNSIRVEKAHNLLRASNDQIIDIAYECGFNSIRTFNRVFKNIKGTSPSIFREFAT